MTHILDANMIKAHLDLFLKAISQMRKNPRIYDMDNKICESTSWEYLQQCYGPRIIQLPSKDSPISEGRIKCSEKIYALRDPLKIVEIPNMIHEAEMLKQEQEQQPNFLNSEYPFASSRAHQTSREKTTLRSESKIMADKIILPQDIILLIMDRLPSFKDIWLLLRIFPHWRPMVPKSYWRSRFVQDLMLEYNEVPGLDALDWHHLYFFKIDHLFKTSHGLKK
jgi:hypothetical protein